MLSVQEVLITSYSSIFIWTLIQYWNARRIHPISKRYHNINIAVNINGYLYVVLQFYLKGQCWMEILVNNMIFPLYFGLELVQCYRVFLVEHVFVKGLPQSPHSPHKNFVYKRNDFLVLVGGYAVALSSVVSFLLSVMSLWHHRADSGTCFERSFHGPLFIFGGIFYASMMGGGVYLLFRTDRSGVIEEKFSLLIVWLPMAFIFLAALIFIHPSHWMWSDIEYHMLPTSMIVYGWLVSVIQPLMVTKRNRPEDDTLKITINQKYPINTMELFTRYPQNIRLAFLVFVQKTYPYAYPCATYLGAWLELHQRKDATSLDWEEFTRNHFFVEDPSLHPSRKTQWKQCMNLQECVFFFFGEQNFTTQRTNLSVEENFSLMDRRKFCATVAEKFSSGGFDLIVASTVTKQNIFTDFITQTTHVEMFDEAYSYQISSDASLTDEFMQ